MKTILKTSLFLCSICLSALPQTVYGINQHQLESFKNQALTTGKQLLLKADRLTTTLAQEYPAVVLVTGLVLAAGGTYVAFKGIASKLPKVVVSLAVAGIGVFLLIKFSQNGKI